MNKLSLVVLLLLGKLALVTPASAQVLKGNEYVAGAGLNIGLRGPWVAKSWRRPVPRFLLAQTMSLGYEVIVDCHGWNEAGHKPWRDLQGRLIGYVAAEVVLAGIRRVTR